MQGQVAHDQIKTFWGKGQEFLVGDQRFGSGAFAHGQGKIALDQFLDTAAFGKHAAQASGPASQIKGDGEFTVNIFQTIT